MSDATTTKIEPESTVTDFEQPKKRGNPNWSKKVEIGESGKFVKRADVLDESHLMNDIWHVQNKDPKLHYVWGRKNDDQEMNMFAQRGYVPASGDEKIFGNPFESKKDTEGNLKERGQRILMCCPKHMVEARRKEQAKRYIDPGKSAKAEARQMSREGVVVTASASSETKRESIAEGE